MRIAPIDDLILNQEAAAPGPGGPVPDLSLHADMTPFVLSVLRGWHLSPIRIRRSRQVVTEMEGRRVIGFVAKPISTGATPIGIGALLIGREATPLRVGARQTREGVPVI